MATYVQHTSQVHNDNFDFEQKDIRDMWSILLYSILSGKAI